MNRIQPENVHSNIFTPREYQVELLWQCLQQNTVSVLASSSTKIFLATCLCKELHYLYALAAQKTDRETPRASSARAVVVSSSYTCLRRISKSIQQNTSLSVAVLPQALHDVSNWTDDTWQLECLDYQVVLVTSAVAASFATRLGLSSACLLFLADAQLCLTDASIRKLIELVPRGCRLVGCTPPLLPRSSSAPSPPPHLLHAFIRRLRATTGCAVTTVSDLVAVIGNENRATEHVVVCGRPEPGLRSSTENEVRRLLAEARAFLFNHRYDPVEIYGEEYREFCAGVPDPKKQPTAILDNFEAVLNELGLWCCDRAALYALVEIEKLKKKTAYDRHYLLLCMVFTVMARIRIVIEECFDDHTELDQILNFSTPKVLRLIAILRRIRPLHFVDPRNRNKDIVADAAPSVAGGRILRCPLHHVMEKTLDVGLAACALSDDDEDDEEEENELNDSERSEMAEAVLGIYTYDDVIRDATVTEVTDDDIAKLNRQGWFGRADTEEVLQDDARMHECAMEEGDESRPSSRNRNVSTEIAHVDNVFCDSATRSDLPLKHCLVNRLRCVDDVDVESVDSFQSCQDRLEELTMEENKSSLFSDINGFRQYNNVQSSPDDLLVDKDRSVLTNGACSVGACLGLSCSKRVQHFSYGCDPSHCATVANTSAKTCSGTNTPEVFSSCTASPIKCKNVSNGPSSVANLTSFVGNVSLRSMRDSASDSTSESEACDSQLQCDSTMAVNESSDESPLGGDRSSQTITKKKCVTASCSSAAVVTNGFNSMCTTRATSACVNNCDNNPSNEGLDSSNCNKLLDCSSEGFVADDRRHNESLHKNAEKGQSVSTENISEIVLEATSLTCHTISSAPASAPKTASEEVPGVSVACTCPAAAVTGASYLPVGQQQRAGGRRRRGDAEVKEKVKVHNPDDPDSVCGLIFVYNSNTAKILYRLLKELSDIGGDFAWIFPQYTVEVGAGRCDGGPPPDEKMLDADHKKQEEVLRRFRHLECNLLVATKVLEEGIDVPLCTLVIRCPRGGEGRGEGSRLSDSLPPGSRS